MALANFQLYIAIGLPVIAVLASLTVSLVQISSIREEMRGGLLATREDTRNGLLAAREDTRSGFQAIHEEMREMREDMREMRSDLKLLTGKVYELMGQK